ncbi:hypothetical protein [Halopseudomonas sp.]|uniref:hypothetical protein n=1 Tax=Halopseudomonas sp. TaxID=2901191 RepID=UPI003563F8B5
MSGLVDEPIGQGTRKRADYETRQRARLALNIERIDGGTLQIIVESDMRSHEEEADIQQNTFLAVMPLARLPGHERYDEQPKGALPRAGRIYIFRQGKLWRELACDGQGNLSDVDVMHWRRGSAQANAADNRPAVGKQQSLVLVPMLLQGQFVGNDYEMTYSELPWTWEYISWLEEDRSRVTDRCQTVGPAWSAAVIGGDQWSASQSMPITVIDKEADGLRPRDFSIESLMDDPALFKPALSAIPPSDWAVKLQQTLEQLAVHEAAGTAQPLTSFTATSDVLTEKSLRGYPQLVGLMLDDPLFTMRHAIAQIRLAEQHLLALNALIPYSPNGRYAQVLHSTVLHERNSPLAKFKSYLDTDRIDDAVFENQRLLARDYMEAMLERLLRLFDGSLAQVAKDWLISNDERLLEPYVWLAEALDALSKNPAQSDALYFGSMRSSLQRSLGRVSGSLLTGTHDLTRGMLANADGELPDAVVRIQALAENGRQPDPENMGLSSLLQMVDIDPEDTDRGLVFKSLHALIGDVMDYFSVTVLAHLNRLQASEVVLQVDFHRLFAPSLGIVGRLSPKWHGLQLMTAGEAQTQNLRILGVNTGNLRNGLTPAERTTLTRKHYLYGNILDHENRVIGSSSPRQLGGNMLPNQGSTTLIVAPENHPEVRKFSSWKSTISDHVDTVVRTPAMPLVAVACALYNLRAQTEDMRGLLDEGFEGELRYTFGRLSAGADLTIAIGNLTKYIFGSGHGLVQFLNKPRIEVPRLLPKWRTNLITQTGSSKIPLLRIAPGLAILISAALCTWDAKRAWHQGDRNAAVAYGIAATGGATWGAYALGMSINPIVLAAGAILCIGGSIVAGWLIDSDIEALLKNGPFGRQHGEAGLIDSVLGDDQRFAHLANPQNAYTQLLGILGKPVIRVERFSDWSRSAPEYQQKQVKQIGAHRSMLPNNCQPTNTIPFDEEDWAVTLHSPLLSMLGTGAEFRLHAIEEMRSLSLTGAFNAERVNQRVIDDAKLAALPLNDSMVLYVLPRKFPVLTMTPLQRHYNKVTQSLKVMAQFHIDPEENTGKLLVVPQPSPKRWQPYSTAFLHTPAQNAKSEEVPYWLIETTEFKV